jgi:hypothetical protein
MMLGKKREACSQSGVFDVRYPLDRIRRYRANGVGSGQVAHHDGRLEHRFGPRMVCTPVLCRGGGCAAELAGATAAQEPRSAPGAAFARRAPNGATEAIMLAHGFTIEMLVDLVQEGLATATPETVHAGKGSIEVVGVRITDAGRLALAG